MREAIAGLAAGLLATGVQVSGSGAAERETLKLAAWNLEWLIAPQDFTRLARDCASELPRGEGRVLPCDIVSGSRRSLQRGEEDFARLREYARRLDADVVALQEVDGEQAARLVFPGYRFCFTRREHLQNVGFAVRSGIEFRCGPDYSALGLDGSVVRWGADLTLYPGTPNTLRLLSVHLKSGCARQLLTNTRDDCRMLAEQVPLLERWIDGRAEERVPFAVIGDFNRRLVSERAYARDRRGRVQALWPEIDDGNPPEANLVNAADGQLYIPCHSGERYSAFIDYIVLSRSLGERVVPSSFERIRYDNEDVRRYRLSDHCPVAVTLRVPAN